MEAEHLAHGQTVADPVKLLPLVLDSSPKPGSKMQ